ncbi:MAG: hypothetical protein ACK5AZ_07535 [Bryobacteraceae bacterium]
MGSSEHPASAAAGKPLVKGLFAASCVLSVVSYYTTQQGMALYLSTWFAVLASLGVQSALVLVAWLIGIGRSRKPLLVSVYAVTAVVSIAFSYVSLYTWFTARERPAIVQRKLYDELTAATARTEQILTAAIAEGQRHILALEEMTNAERSHGYISRATDSDPYLAKLREAAAREALTYQGLVGEGSGEGPRYAAFHRYTEFARQSLARIEEARKRLAEYRAGIQPLHTSEKQLQDFHAAINPIPWTEVEETLHGEPIQRPVAPAYADFIDHSASGQEDLLLAFQELFTAPNSRHGFSLALAAFIDIVIFLVAYAAGPYFHGSEEQRWCAAGAAMDSIEDQIFVRSLLEKVRPGPRGIPQVDATALTPGEQQFCLLLTAKGLAAIAERDGTVVYTMEPRMHEYLLDSLSTRGLSLRSAEGNRLCMEPRQL